MTTATARCGRATTIVWAILSAITLVSLWLGPSPAGESFVASVPITVVVLAMALIKTRLIIQYFMEVRTAPEWLKVATDAWLVTLFGGMLAIYLW
jgi:hypothetical protein